MSSFVCLFASWMSLLFSNVSWNSTYKTAKMSSLSYTLINYKYSQNNALVTPDTYIYFSGSMTTWSEDNNKKCRLFLGEVQYLRRIVFVDVCCRLNPTNFQVVTKLVKQKPNTFRDTISLLGMVISFVKHLSNVSVKKKYFMNLWRKLMNEAHLSYQSGSKTTKNY